MKYRSTACERFIKAMRRRGRVTPELKTAADRLVQNTRGGARNKGLPSPHRGKTFGVRQWHPSRLRLIGDE